MRICSPYGRNPESVIVVRDGKRGQSHRGNSNEIRVLSFFFFFYIFILFLFFIRFSFIRARSVPFRRRRRHFYNDFFFFRAGVSRIIIWYDRFFFFFILFISPVSGATEKPRSTRMLHRSQWERVIFPSSRRDFFFFFFLSIFTLPRTRSRRARLRRRRPRRRRVSFVVPTNEK